jgi:basic membrane protein A
MKNIISLLVLSLVLMSCAKKSAEENKASVPAAKLKAGLVFDVGGRGDKSFNDAAYLGLERGKKELGVDYEVFEPGEGADREAALRQLASKPDVGIIFGIGFIFTDDITAIAKEFPDKKFACVDYSLDTTKLIPQNLLPIEFREEEGSFLVGAIAALSSKTGKVGFVGGMESPLIKKFEHGYAAGAKYANPKTEVFIGYAGTTGDAFKNPAKGKELALVQFNKGADVIYHASGVTGLGVMEAALQQNKFAIGVDQNQEAAAPGRVLTSMVKIVDVAVFETIKAAKDGKFTGGKALTLGLADKGVDYIYNDNNKFLITPETRQKAEVIREKIVKGELHVSQ